MAGALLRLLRRPVRMVLALAIVVLGLLLAAPPRTVQLTT